MKARPLCVTLVAALALSLAALQASAQDGLPGALTRADFASASVLDAPFRQTLAAADLDGDGRSDGAVLVDGSQSRLWGSRRTIELHFTRRGNTTLVIDSNEAALGISVLDVDGDGATDIVVERPLTHKRLQVWLNDGRGGFRKVPSEDFPFLDDGNGDRLTPPFRPSDSPAVCLPPQRGPEVAVVNDYLPRSSSCSTPWRAFPLGKAIESQSISPNSPRPPPRTVPS